MITKDLMEIVQKRSDSVTTTLDHKKAEYGSATDRFHNVKRGGEILGCTPEQALGGFMSKHVVSVYDMIEWSEVSPERITLELIDEKIGDNIVYLYLLEGLLKERLNS
jgi:hypothetical protein